MKKGLVILVALSIALVMGASMLLAQEKMPVEQEKGTCKKEMKLTDEQKAKIDQMKTDLRLKMIDLKAEREKLAIALRSEMKKPEPSMQEIEGIVKKLSAVREKIQLTMIEHRLAMRKLVGRDGCMGGSHGMGEGCAGMEGEHGMMGCGGGNAGCGEKHGKAMMEHPPMGMRQGREAAGRRMMVVKTDGSGCVTEHGGPVMWHQRAGNADYVVTVKEAHQCNHPKYGNWYHKMYRPFGRSNAHQMMGGCTMGQGGHEGCMKKCTEKEIKCKVEITEEKK